MRAHDQTLRRRGTRQPNLRASALTNSFRVPLCRGDCIARVGVAVTAPKERVGGHALYPVAIEL
jgi:hypothetical protein